MSAIISNTILREQIKSSAKQLCKSGEKRRGRYLIWLTEEEDSKIEKLDRAKQKAEEQRQMWISKIIYSMCVSVTYYCFSGFPASVMHRGL